jgi:hypothetical protein
MAGWSEPGRPIYRPLRRLLAIVRRALRLDELDRRQTRCAWEDWADVRPGPRDRAELVAVSAHEGEAEPGTDAGRAW